MGSDGPCAAPGPGMTSTAVGADESRGLGDDAGFPAGDLQARHQDQQPAARRPRREQTRFRRRFHRRRQQLSVRIDMLSRAARRRANTSVKEGPNEVLNDRRMRLGVAQPTRKWSASRRLNNEARRPCVLAVKRRPSWSSTNDGVNSTRPGWANQLRVSCRERYRAGRAQRPEIRRQGRPRPPGIE